MTRGTFRGNILQVELGPGVGHVFGLLDCMLPSFLQNTEGNVRAGAVGQGCSSLLLPRDFPALFPADYVSEREIILPSVILPGIELPTDPGQKRHI